MAAVLSEKSSRQCQDDSVTVEEEVVEKGRKDLLVLDDVDDLPQ